MPAAQALLQFRGGPPAVRVYSSFIAILKTALQNWSSIFAPTSRQTAAHNPPKCGAVWRSDYAPFKRWRDRTQNRFPLLLIARRGITRRFTVGTGAAPGETAANDNKGETKHVSWDIGSGWRRAGRADRDPGRSVRPRALLGKRPFR